MSIEEKLYENGPVMVYYDVVCHEYLVCQNEGVRRIDHARYPVTDAGLADAKKRCDELASKVQS